MTNTIKRSWFPIVFFLVTGVISVPGTFSAISHFAALRGAGGAAIFKAWTDFVYAPCALILAALLWRQQIRARGQSKAAGKVV
jgi:hypothetical protein